MYYQNIKKKNNSQSLAINTYLQIIEAIMHHWNEVVNVHSLHLFDVGGDGLECWEADIEVDVIKVSLIKRIELQEMPLKPCKWRHINLKQNW